MRFALWYTSLLSLIAAGLISSQAAANQCENLFLAERLHSDPPPASLETKNGTGFIVPNEKNIGDVRSLFSVAPSGVFVTVGTERGFISAAMTGKATKSLVLVDRDPKVLLFNLVNKSLLELAKDRSDYVDMRLRASFEIVSNRAIHSSSLSSEARDILSSRENWSWWTEQVQKSSAWTEFHDPAQTNFKNANYLFDEQLFNSISALAKVGRIFVFNADLKSDDLLLKVQDLSRTLGLRLAVLDFSNAWDEGYIGLNGTSSIISSMKNMTAPETLYVFTYLAPDSDVRNNSSMFRYWFVSEGQLAGPSQLQSMLGAFMRRDPSRATSTTRSRVNRFDSDF
ncbi:hypothetical protein BH10BDE1_BH10BDE1_01320 [soil metagenome]